MRKVVISLVAALAVAGVGVGSAAAADSTSTKACTKLIYKFERNANVYTYLSGSEEVKFTAYKGNKFVYTKGTGTGGGSGSYLGDVYTSDWKYRGDGWVWKGHLDYLYCK